MAKSRYITVWPCRSTHTNAHTHKHTFPLWHWGPKQDLLGVEWRKCLKHSHCFLLYFLCFNKTFMRVVVPSRHRSHISAISRQEFVDIDYFITCRAWGNVMMTHSHLLLCQTLLNLCYAFCFYTRMGVKCVKWNLKLLLFYNWMLVHVVQQHTHSCRLLLQSRFWLGIPV